MADKLKAHAPSSPRMPMFVETVTFLAGVPFFTIVGLVYGFLSGWEPVGTTCLILLGGLFGMAGGYLYITAKRIDARPEDDPQGEIHQRAGEYGEFSPQSWWPLVLGISVTLMFGGIPIGWWMVGIGAVVGLVGITGQLFEKYRGQHAH